MNAAQAEQIKREIVIEMLPSIIFDGWTITLAESVATLQGRDKTIIRALFPSGITDMLRTFSDIADEEMLKSLDALDTTDMGTTQKVETAVLKRLEWLAPHKDALKESINILGVPLRKPAATKMVWHTCDAIWNWAGDTATDYNHYTKRGLLSGVLVSTTLYWVNDDSDDLGRTEQFLSRRISDITKIVQFISRFKRA